MKLPRLSLSWMMAGVALVALDCYIVSIGNAPGRLVGVSECIGAFNVLVLCGIDTVRRMRQRSPRPFVVGFLSVGWSAALARSTFWWLPWPLGDCLRWWVDRVDVPIFDALISSSWYPVRLLESDNKEFETNIKIIIFAFDLLGVSLPLLLVALAGGLLCRAVAGTWAWALEWGRGGKPKAG